MLKNALDKLSMDIRPSLYVIRLSEQCIRTMPYKQIFEVAECEKIVTLQIQDGVGKYGTLTLLLCANRVTKLGHRVKTNLNGWSGNSGKVPSTNYRTGAATTQGTNLNDCYNRN